jgi:hypothetical protein
MEERAPEAIFNGLGIQVSRVAEHDFEDIFSICKP